MEGQRVVVLFFIQFLCTSKILSVFHHGESALKTRHSSLWAAPVLVFQEQGDDPDARSDLRQHKGLLRSFICIWVKTESLLYSTFHRIIKPHPKPSDWICFTWSNVIITGVSLGVQFKSIMAVIMSWPCMRASRKMTLCFKITARNNSGYILCKLMRAKPSIISCGFCAFLPAFGV